MKRSRFRKLGQKARDLLIIGLAMLMAIPPTALQAGDPNRPEWVESTTKNVRKDFQSRLDAVEGDPTRQIVGGKVVDAGYRWTDAPAVRIEAGTAYYVQSPDNPNLDTMMVRSMAEAQSAYAAAMKSGKWTGVQIIHVQNGPDGLAQMQVGGEEVPLISYASIDEIGATKEDMLAASLIEQHFKEVDPSGELLASYVQEEETWLASLPPKERDSLVNSSELMYVSYPGSRASRNGCQPCQIQQLPNCAPGAVYAQQTTSDGNCYRQCQPQQQMSRNCESGNCNLGILAGPRHLFNGDFIKNRPRKQADFMSLTIPQRLFARAFPRLAYNRGLVGCTTAQALVGQRFLAILIGVSIGVGAAGGGAAIPIFLGQAEPDVEVPKLQELRELRIFSPELPQKVLVAAVVASPYVETITDSTQRVRSKKTGPPEFTVLAA